jgi:hypothetical protein
MCPNKESRTLFCQKTIEGRETGYGGKVYLQRDTAGTADMNANNYFEGWVNQKPQRLDLSQVEYCPAVRRQGGRGLNFPGAMVQGGEEGSFRGRLGSHKRGFPEAAVLGQVEQQQQRQNEHNHPFHHSLRNRLCVPLLMTNV